MGLKASKGAPHGPKPKQCIHSPLPVDTVPYPGPPLQYLLCQVPVQLSSNVSFGFSAGQTMVTSNVDSYYRLLAQYYQQGYLLHTFYCVPGAAQATGFAKVSNNFEAIFSKPADGSPAEGGVPYDLRIEKSMMFLQMMNYGIISMGPQGSVAQTNDILQKIAQHSAQGGRLVCIEMTGFAQSQGMSAAMSGVSQGMGVDIFFNIPKIPSPPVFTYQAVNVPIMVSLAGGFPNPTVRADCDWLGNMAMYLNQGWRLVEIFLDKGMMRQGGFTASYQLNSVWFYEKEAARLNDPTPLYEGSVINYTHKIKAGFGGTSVKSDWTPVIQQMGQMGWELACPLETPAQHVTGFGKVDMQMLLFFQRRLLQRAAPPYQPPPYPGVAEGGGLPPVPPPGDEMQGKMPLP